METIFHQGRQLADARETSLQAEVSGTAAAAASEPEPSDRVTNCVTTGLELRYAGQTTTDITPHGQQRNWQYGEPQTWLRDEETTNRFVSRLLRF